MTMVRTFALLLAVLAAPGLAAQHDHGDGAGTAAAAVRAVLSAYADFAQAKNVPGMDTLFAGDRWVHIIEGAGVNHGWADYRDHHIGPELAELQDFRYRYFDIEPQVRGDVAWAPFRYELSARTAEGPIGVEGRGTAVLERRDGRWVIVHLHTSGRRRATP